MTVISINHSICKDLACQPVTQHLVNQIFFVKQKIKILKFLLAKRIKINFKDLKLIYLVKIPKLKIINLVNISFNKQVQDSRI
jgi:hypothetical protein